MKQLTVVSGKGGTGKTTLSGSFAYLARDAVILDADVDASNLHLLFPVQVETKMPYSGGKKAFVDEARCTGCGICQELCRFEAIALDGGVARVNPFSCEGCNACAVFCPETAIHMEPVQAGWVQRGNVSGMPLVDGELFPGEETSGGLVATVRKEGQGIAQQHKYGKILIDGAPGTGCPTTSSITYTDFVVIVTEPSQSGLHDLERIVRTVDHFAIPKGVVINKYDLEEGTSARIEQYCATEGIPLMGKVPFDPEVVRAIREARPVVTQPSPAAHAIRELWEEVQRRVF